jgi:hypothetical protein
MKKNFVLIFFVLLCSCKSEPETTKNEIINLHTVSKFCFINAIEFKEHALASVDFIEHEKLSDAIKSELGKPIIELPDGYGYFNKEEKLEFFVIADSVKIVMQKFSYDTEGNFLFNQKIILPELKEKVEKEKHPKFMASPYYVEIKGNKIILLKEIYIP